MLFRRSGAFVAVLWLLQLCYAQSISDIIAALQNMHDCPSCLQALGALQILANMGDAPFVSFASQICTNTDPEVCAGAVARSGPIVAHDLRQINTTGTAANGLCTALFGFCDTKTVNPFTVPLPKKPAKLGIRPAAKPTKRRTPFKVVQISDVHIDREYTPGSEADCNLPLCCRNFNNATVQVPAGPNGNFKCDAPVPLIDSMLEAIRPLNARFAIFTGDVVEAAVWLTDVEEVSNDLTEFNGQLLSKLDMTVYPALGNHDTEPVNAFPRSTSGNQSQFVFDIESSGWKHWIGSTASRQVLHHSGSYSVRVPGTHLRILSVNTQYWYKQNFWLYDSDTIQHDPNGILDFMVKELHQAEIVGEQVWIIGHIPLGAGDTLVDQSNYYDQILQRFRSTIAGQFFGHTHMDQFQIAYSNYSNQVAENAMSVALIGPSATPRDGRNPAFKVLDIDPDTFEVMNYHVYFANLTDPHSQTRLQWKEYYNARQAYGPLVGLKDSEALDPTFWHKLTEAFERNETAFQMYNTFLSRDAIVQPCDADCKNTTICDMRAFRAENNCDVASPGLGFGLSRRDMDSHRVSSHCEGKTFGDFLMDWVDRFRVEG